MVGVVVLLLLLLLLRFCGCGFARWRARDGWGVQWDSRECDLKEKLEELQAEVRVMVVT